jgi:hypothetical protein
VDRRYPTRRIAPLAACVFLLGAVTACSSTIDGRGASELSPSSTGSSSPDFPSSAPVTPSTSAAPPTSVPGSTGRHPVPDQPVRTVEIETDTTTYVVQLWAEVKDETCFDHAYGKPIVTFLTEHPCTGLHRVLGTTEVDGRPVAFAQSSTGFRGTAADPYKYAGEFIRLEKADGTGSINDLLREGYRLPEGPASVPAREAFNVIGQDQGVTIWDVWYLDGPTPVNAKRLIRMTTELFLRF